MSGLDALPSTSDQRVAVRITPDALRRVRAGHPWVYDRSIESTNREGAPGDLAVVFDKQREFAAIGLWDPASAIRLKILHAGRPVTIDAEWFATTIETAVAARAALWEGAPRHRLGYRAVNGENDGLPGLIVDCYADVAVIKLYSDAWLPHLRDLVPSVQAATRAAHVVLRLARSMADRPTFGLDDGDVIVGDPPDPVLFQEGRLTFEADVRRGQKTGHFLDQRANRLQVGKMTKGRSVLDVFASTGGFSVHAAAGGATSVHAIDQSAPTIAVAKRNMSYNHDLDTVAACEFTTQCADAFDALGHLGRSARRFDIVIIDPPSFAQKAATVGRAKAAYAKLTKLAMGVVEQGGVLVQASCSSRVTSDDFFDTVTAAAVEHGARLTEIRRTGHDIDHPVSFPEGAYLKAGYWRVDTGRRARR
ncbi:MAG: class I SAM-dependent rRNA methyltransferase [Ilumatobacter sp.]|uniref:class I SAM-dependent rRNA methyltransferase n=1 Tax=Ilumatobacter sp. TaxID=1967498 RepID=UPI00391A0BB8